MSARDKESVHRVTIGLPVYNAERYLAECLDSLVGQTFSDFELVISDNASTDATAQICREYAGRDGRIRYVRRRVNRGGAWNFNEVFRLSDSAYFKWAAHDDVCAPTLVQRCVEVLDRKASVVLCYPKSHFIDEHSAFLREFTDPYDGTSPRQSHRFRDVLHHVRFANMMFGVMRSSVLRETPLILPYVYSDRILLAELALRGNLFEVPEVLFYRRDHPDRTLRAMPSLRALAEWHDPFRRDRTPLPQWRLLCEHLRSIRHVAMPPREKARCYLEMLRIAKWTLPTLRAECRTFASERFSLTARRRDA